MREITQSPFPCTQFACHVLLWSHASHVTHGMIPLCKLSLAVHVDWRRSAIALDFPKSRRHTERRCQFDVRSSRCEFATRRREVKERSVLQTVVTRSSRHQLAIHVTWLIFQIFCSMLFVFHCFYVAAVVVRLRLHSLGTLCGIFFGRNSDIWPNGHHHVGVYGSSHFTWRRPWAISCILRARSCRNYSLRFHTTLGSGFMALSPLACHRSTVQCIVVAMCRT